MYAHIGLLDVQISVSFSSLPEASLRSQRNGRQNSVNYIRHRWKSCTALCAMQNFFEKKNMIYDLIVRQFFFTFMTAIVHHKIGLQLRSASSTY